METPELDHAPAGSVSVGTRTDHADLVVSVTGEIEIGTVADLRARLGPLLDVDAGRRVVLDLSGVAFIDSSGLGAIVRSHKQVRANGGTLVLVVPTASMRRLFEISGLDQVIDVHRSIDDALASRTRP